MTEGLDKELVQAVIDTTVMLEKHPKVLACTMVGSALYHPKPNDIDFLVLVDASSFFPTGEEASPAGRWLFGPDWDTCAGEYDDQDSTWGALRKGKANLIVTVNRGWYDRMVLASKVCEALKLMDKGDRIVVHRVVRDGYEPHEAMRAATGTLQEIGPRFGVSLQMGHNIKTGKQWDCQPST